MRKNDAGRVPDQGSTASKSRNHDRAYKMITQNQPEVYPKPGLSSPKTPRLSVVCAEDAEGAVATADRGPWSPAALRIRTQKDLIQLAEDQHSRHCHPDDILHQLAERAGRWSLLGAAIGAEDVLRILRAVVAADYQPWSDLEHARLKGCVQAGIDAAREQIEQQQMEIVGAAYRDGYMDGASNARLLSREGIVEIVRDVLAADLPAALREIGGGR